MVPVPKSGTLVPKPKLLAWSPADVTHELYNVVGLDDGNSVAFVVVDRSKSEDEAAFKENLDFLFCLLLLCFFEEREEDEGENEELVEREEDICFVEFVLFFTIILVKIDCFFVVTDLWHELLGYKYRTRFGLVSTEIISESYRELICFGLFFTLQCQVDRKLELNADLCKKGWKRLKKLDKLKRTW